MKKALVLLSGGLDSITCLALANSQGFECSTITFNYGQRHLTELEAAKRISQYYNVKRHEIVELPIGHLGGSALTDTHITVPEYEDTNAIPVTYVPARNTIFLAMALAWAEILQAKDIFIGVNAIDYSHYPDCRPEYIAAFQKMANLATKTTVEGRSISINAPLIHLSKAEIIQLGMSLGVDYAMTVSCYQADDEGNACGKCDSCFLRKRGFQEANVLDPTCYY